jgi:signal transduction histidine kinase
VRHPSYWRKAFDSTIKKGIGLANIKRRIELFNGEMQIISAINEGCNLVAIIPLDQISYT